ncbi:phosphatidylinositol N-acetylglucosaminyltransferase subunit GPI1 [Plasmodium sp. DRC-Itaito]|nr:phosphatidylinositol N-acetylglucosaminyltransferase subunit GPI1 [Plasmodium sp. DRC-Itaito]
MSGVNYDIKLNECLSIFFPQNIATINTNTKYYLYGFSNDNIYIIVHITDKYIENFKLKKKHEKYSEWKIFRIVGEISFIESFNELNKNMCTTKNEDNNKVNYLYLIYYNNIPIFKKKSGNEQNISALFILYDVKKYVYNMVDDHVNTLVLEAFRREDIKKKIKVKEKQNNNDTNKENNNGTYKESNIEKDKNKQTKFTDIYDTNSKSDKDIQTNNMKDCDSNNKNSSLFIDPFESDSYEKNNFSNEKCSFQNVDKSKKDKEYIYSENITPSSSSNNNNNNKGNDCDKEQLDKYNKDKDNKLKLNDKDEYISFNFIENKLTESFHMNQIIYLINKKCVFTKCLENYENRYFVLKKEEILKKKKKEKKMSIFSYIVSIILFFTYIISLINSCLYYVICTPKLFSEYIFSKKKINTFILIKHKFIFHSEWHNIFRSFMKNKQNPSEYYKYREILLIRIINLIIDIFLGFLIFFLLYFNVINLHYISEKAQIFYGTSTLTSILGTLLQNPLGFKLNNNFTSFIGSILVSILDKWDLITNTIPVNNSTVLNFVVYTSLLGFSFFLSFAIDYLRFVTAHVTIIYFFLKKICTLFHKNMYSLYLLFNGKKWNILKLRVDTNYYSNEEVLLGTILFTILIFLYPTIFVLVLVFGLIYLIINRIIYLLCVMEKIILYTPFYIFFIQPNCNKYISKGFKFTKYEVGEHELLKRYPNNSYLLLENIHFLFFDKIKLFINIFLYFKNLK